MRTAEAVQAAVEDIRSKGESANKFAEELRDSTLRTARKLRDMSEDALDQTRHQIKTKPLATVAIVSAGWLGIGLLAGYLLGRRRGW